MERGYALCCALKRRAFMRLPQTLMSHQRRVWFLLVSRKSQRHWGSAQARREWTASEVRRPEADWARSQTGRLGSLLEIQDGWRRESLQARLRLDSAVWR